MGCRRVHKVFLGAVLLVLLCVIPAALLFPRTVSESENRYAVTLSVPSADGLLEGTYQQELEQGLSDQTPFAEGMRLWLHGLSAKLRRALLKEQNIYTSFGDVYVFGGDWLVYAPLDGDEVIKDAGDNIAWINSLIADHPELDFYGYYIEKDTDVNFETGEKAGISDRLGEALGFPEGQFRIFRVEDFEDYAERFYKTDHHWNHRGSRQGYEEILAMLKPEETPLEPLEEVTTAYTLSGPKAASAGAKGVFTEPFMAYRYEFPNLEITIDGKFVPDYGHQEQYLAGTLTSEIRYARFYGGDKGEVVLHNPEGKGNLLILGDSHDNAILKLLACHYENIYAVDLRYTARFRFSGYVEGRGIDTVLFLGSAGFYRSPDFIGEG